MTEQQASDIQRRGMRSAFIAQCTGNTGSVAFTNSLMLLYFLAVGLGDTASIAVVSLFSITQAASSIPAAFFADTRGIKKIGNIGNLMCIGGFLLLLLTGAVPLGLATLLAVGGTLIFSFGQGVLYGGWYALLWSIVPAFMRGRFFGKLRFLWQSVGLGVSIIVAVSLSRDAPVWKFQLFIAIITLGLIARFFYYNRIPEEGSEKSTDSFWTALKAIIFRPGVTAFSAYVFLTVTFSHASPVLFTMIEKDALKLSSSLIMGLSSAHIIGLILGFLLIGKIIDKFGCRMVFLCCHFAFFILMGLFICRDAAHLLLFPVLWSVHFLYGLVMAAISVAITTETFSLMYGKNRALCGSVLSAFQFAGVSLGGLLCAGVLKLDFLKKDWHIAYMQLSAYDAILMIYALMILLLVVTLGLVPSVMKPATGEK